MKKVKDNMVEKIIVKYDDGTEKEILKGVIITDEDTYNEDGDHNLTFEFASMSGTEVANVIIGCVQLGTELGLFNDAEEADE